MDGSAIFCCGFSVAEAPLREPARERWPPHCRSLSFCGGQTASGAEGGTGKDVFFGSGIEARISTGFVTAAGIGAGFGVSSASMSRSSSSWGAALAAGTTGQAGAAGTLGVGISHWLWR